MRLLLATKIDKDHVNNLGWTALLEAVVLGDGGPAHTEIVRLLVEAGANVNIADRDGVTPLAHAKQRGYAEMVRILSRRRRARCRRVAMDADTPLRAMLGKDLKLQTSGGNS